MYDIMNTTTKDKYVLTILFILFSLFEGTASDRLEAVFSLRKYLIIGRMYAKITDGSF